MASLVEMKVRNHPKVAEVSDERNSDGGIWAYLHYGHRVYDEYHQVHEDTWTDVLKALRNVEPCNCKECAAHVKQTLNLWNS